MTEDFEIEALEYLLEEMEPGRRAAFEEMLAHDSAARQTLKACADSLARFATSTAPAEPLTATDQQAVLTAILATTSQTKPASGGAEKSNVIAWSRYFWPMAAAVLLGINLLQLSRSPQDIPQQDRAPRQAQFNKTGSADERTPGVAATSDGETLPAASNSASGNLASPSRMRAGEPLRGAGGSAEARRLEQLRQDYAELQRNNEALRAEYDSLIRHVADRAVIEKTVGRLATMELVDAASYTRGERKGLMEVARGILTEPGVVVATFANTPVTDPKTPTGGEVTIGANIGPTTPTDPTTPTAVDTRTPYAWSVYDDKENRGYLNLYNLPKTSEDQSLQLWVKTVDSSTYQRVGEVPAQFQGSNGSLYYTLPTATSVPSEILITQEPRATVGAEPVGSVVLRGP